MKLSDLSELGFVETLREWIEPAHLEDDAAVVEVGDQRLAITTDALVDGIHFRTDWSDASDIGWKCVAVNVSDLAAMGAEPRFMLTALCAPPETENDFVHALYRGVAEACAAYGCRLVGGDTVRSATLTVSVTAIGTLDGEPLRRSGAKVGDVVAVTGPLGRAATGVNLLLSQDPKSVSPEDAIACIDAHRRPQARVEEGLHLRRVAHAAIDISDGLAIDARHLAEASRVGIDIDLLPVAPEASRIAQARGWEIEKLVFAGGEDFELLVAVPEGEAGDLIKIGRVVESGVTFKGEPLAPVGFDHFAS